MTIIVSVGDDMEIGAAGDLCWRISDDLKRFKALTMGGALIMGRKTWESLPRKPLPGRLNIVVTRGGIEESGDNIAVADSLEKALETAGSLPVFIIGGESIYRQAFPYATNLEITHIYDNDPEADRFFPEVRMQDWELTAKSEMYESPDGVKYDFESYKRITTE